MMYFKNRDLSVFYKIPANFNKYTNRDVLQYAIGANMYTPGNKKNMLDKLINNKFKDVGAITLCCEDAIKESDLKEAEENILNLLDGLHEAIKEKPSLKEDIPLIFIRVRGVEHLKEFSNKFKKHQIQLLAGFVFPKFNSNNGREYFKTLKNLADKHADILYGMPILEDETLIYKENRFKELKLITDILNDYSGMVLNIRVGGTDFSSRFGLRRGINNTIYDIRVVADCLIDILNFFLRMEHGYVVSGPVWEYFSTEEQSLAVQGLIKELELDMQNGFYGKTVIHPTQIKYINEKYIVAYTEYVDAVNILSAKGGVFKGCNGDRMNEVAPHVNWAKKIINRAKIFGVLNKGASF